MALLHDIREKKTLRLVVAIVFLVAAGAVLAYTYWPARRASLAQAFFSDDDGQTWFAADTTNVAPFDHNGKTAVMAEIFTYNNGSKKFCGYLEKYTPEAKAKLQAAFSQAKANGQPAGSIGLFHNPSFMQSAVLLKKPGAGNPWITYSDPRANEIINVHSPDGSAVDQYFVY